MTSSLATVSPSRPCLARVSPHATFCNLREVLNFQGGEHPHPSPQRPASSCGIRRADIVWQLTQASCVPTAAGS